MSYSLLLKICNTINLTPQRATLTFNNDITKQKILNCDNIDNIRQYREIELSKWPTLSQRWRKRYVTSVRQNICPRTIRRMFAQGQFGLKAHAKFHHRGVRPVAREIDFVTGHKSSRQNGGRVAAACHERVRSVPCLHNRRRLDNVAWVFFNFFF